MDYLDRLISQIYDIPDCSVLRCIDEDEQGRYWITDKGDVYSICRNKIIKKTYTDNGKGYYQVKLAGKTFYKHRLLAFYFNNDQSKKYIDINNEDYIVHHIDFDRYNNNIENLCIMSRAKHNTIHNIINKLERLDKDI